MYFVWWKDFACRYCPQKWEQLDYGVNDWKRPYIGVYHKLTPKLAELPLDELAKLFSKPEASQ